MVGFLFFLVKTIIFGGTYFLSDAVRRLIQTKCLQYSSASVVNGALLTTYYTITGRKRFIWKKVSIIGGLVFCLILRVGRRSAAMLNKGQG